MEARIWNDRGWIKGLKDPKHIRTLFDDMLKQSGFKVLQCTEHYFTPVGYTALWLLSESHFAIHTFPEEDKVYYEISSCNYEYFDIFCRRLNSYIKTLNKL